MINRVHVRNFQSLADVRLDLGLFTVIVGPSSSGKSALIRAFKALASNVRGTGNITRGQKAMSVTVWTDTHVITLERSERAGHYKLATLNGEPDVFGKLNGAVPAAVTDALRIDPVGDSGSVNFAGQFDRPYLLDESGSAVARQLGELTNVTQIFEAVRAAVRVATSTNTTLKARRADLDLLRSRLADYAGLGDRLQLLERVDTLDQRRRDLTVRIRDLSAAITTVEQAQDVLSTVQVRTPPDDTGFKQLLQHWHELRALVADLDDQSARLRKIDTETEASAHALQHLEMDFKMKLAHAGVCPTCGQQTIA